MRLKEQTDQADPSNPRAGREGLQDAGTPSGNLSTALPQVQGPNQQGPLLRTQTISDFTTGTGDAKGVSRASSTKIGV